VDCLEPPRAALNPETAPLAPPLLAAPLAPSLLSGHRR
jgi:hypothetical protein